MRWTSDAVIRCSEDREGRDRPARDRRAELLPDPRLRPAIRRSVMAGEAGASDQAIRRSSCARSSAWTSRCRSSSFIYVKGVVTLDLGFSFRQQMPVAEADRRASAGDAAADADGVRASRCCCGIPFGTLAARFAGTWADTAITVLGAAVLRHADLLGRADGDPAVLRRSRTGCRASATRPSARTIPAARMCSTSPCIWSCRR